MSGSVNLNIVTAQDWGVALEWKDAEGTLVTFTDPQMDIREDLSPNGTLIASFTESGEQLGKATITGPGALTLSMSASATSGLPAGNAFWDLFVTTTGNVRVKMLFGTISITPHVTADALG